MFLVELKTAFTNFISGAAALYIMVFLSYTVLMKSQNTVQAGSNAKLAEVMARKRAQAAGVVTGVVRVLEQRRSSQPR